MKIKKIVYITLGCIGVGLGALGAVLPLLPAFPFLLLAAFCFGKSSEKLHTWFAGTKLYKDNLESYVQGKGMTRKTKVRIMVTVTILMSIGFIMMRQVPVGRIILGYVWMLHVLYFAFGVKNVRSESPSGLPVSLSMEGVSEKIPHQIEKSVRMELNYSDSE
ncbi:MAG: YbaN family protein [Marvinbryantia sp.]|jgi:uncharacterized membrane protein YbaN (DUF454 family)